MIDEDEYVCDKCGRVSSLYDPVYPYWNGKHTVYECKPCAEDSIRVEGLEDA